MAAIRFAKLHGLGNDYLVIEEEALGGRAPGDVTRAICHRHTGVGADGIALLTPADEGRWQFRIFNADGGEAGLSGNAMRCAVAWLASRTEQLEPGLTFTLKTRVGQKRHIFRGRRGKEYVFQSEIVRPSFAGSKIPFQPPEPVAEATTGYPLPIGEGILPVTPLWMGNPQCVALVEDLEQIDWMRLGPQIEHHPYFPERTNAGFVHVVARDRIEARFWERGVGHTSASGTGSSACAVAAAVNGKTGRRVTVVTELGEMLVHWREDDDVVELTGPAELTAEGVFYPES